MSEAYPLDWPSNFERTSEQDRVRAKFSKKNNKGWQDRLSVSEALKRLISEVKLYTRVGRDWRINPDLIVVSTNLRVRRDGLPHSGQREPDDPGVAVYFNLDGEDRCIPVDTYDRVADNIAAIAQCLCDLRSLERHGYQVMERAFTGFTALPDTRTDRWWVVLGVSRDDSPQTIKEAFMRKRSATHPDNEGDKAEFQKVMAAYEEALAYFQSR